MLAAVMYAVSFLGFTAYCVAAAVVLALAHRVRAGAALLILIALNGLVVNATKVAVSFPRPDAVDTRIERLGVAATGGETFGTFQDLHTQATNLARLGNPATPIDRARGIARRVLLIAAALTVSGLFLDVPDPLDASRLLGLAAGVMLILRGNWQFDGASPGVRLRGSRSQRFSCLLGRGRSGLRYTASGWKMGRGSC
jgi:hypothetical protein